MPLPGCCKVSNPTSLTAAAATTTMRKGAAIVERERTRDSVGKTIAKLQVRERESASARVHVRSVSRRICALRFLCCCQLVRSSPILHNISNSNNNKPLSHSKHSEMRKTAAVSSSESELCVWGSGQGEDLCGCRPLSYPRLTPPLKIEKAKKSNDNKNNNNNSNAAHLRRVNANKSCVVHPVRELRYTHTDTHIHTPAHAHAHLHTHTHAWMQFALEEEREEVTLVTAQSYLQCWS